TPPVVMRPILLALYSVNHSAPSGPAAIPAVQAHPVATGYSVIIGFAGVAFVGIRPILLALYSVNHSAPSGPTAILSGLLLALGVAYWVMAPPVGTRPIWLWLRSVRQRA